MSIGVTIPMGNICIPPVFRYKPAGASKPSMFLAGSIEMGAAEDWQSIAIRELTKCTSIIYNPRRDDWDSSWKQDISDPQFNVQVNWELEMLEKSDFVIFYFDPNTKSPITLMELGYMARKKNVYVCCPEGFWRKGNVDIICERNGITRFGDFNLMLSYLSMRILSTNWNID